MGHHVAPHTSWNAETGQGDAYEVYAYAAVVADVSVDVRMVTLGASPEATTVQPLAVDSVVAWEGHTVWSVRPQTV